MKYIILLFFTIEDLHIVWTIEFLYMTNDRKMFILKYQLHLNNNDWKKFWISSKII